MKAELKCRSCGRSEPLSAMIGKCRCGGTFVVEYDMERAGRTITHESLRHRQSSMWRYHELLPINNLDHIVSLGEGWTPLIRLARLEQQWPVKELWVKREEQNPTGSFKSRGMSVAISMAKEYGLSKVAVNSNGNAASALAAYAGAAGMEASVFLPQDCPGLIVEECRMYGAATYRVDGLIHDAGAIIEEGMVEQGWHHVGTLKEPGRAEGKKTMGFELAEQMDWQLPDVIIYPTGGGSGVIGMWNAFLQLKQLGLTQSDMPRMISVQEQGCEPLVYAMHHQDLPPDDPVTSSPTGMRVPLPPDLSYLRTILQQTDGTAIAVSKEAIIDAQLTLGKHGISASPEGAATYAGFMKLISSNWLRPDDRVVLFNTCHGLKYVPFDPSGIPIIRTYYDLKQLTD